MSCGNVLRNCCNDNPDCVPSRQLLSDNKHAVAIAVYRRQLLPVQQHDSSHSMPCWKLVSKHQHDVTHSLLPSWNLLPFQRHVGRDHLPVWKLLPKRRNQPLSLSCGNVSANASRNIGIRLPLLRCRQLLPSGLHPQCFMPCRHIHLRFKPHSTVAML